MANNNYGRRRAPKDFTSLYSDLQRATTKLPKEAQTDIQTFGRKLLGMVNEVSTSLYLGAPAPHDHSDAESGGVLDQAEFMGWVAYVQARKSRI